MEPFEKEEANENRLYDHKTGHSKEMRLATVEKLKPRFLYGARFLVAKTTARRVNQGDQ